MFLLVNKQNLPKIDLHASMKKRQIWLWYWFLGSDDEATDNGNTNGTFDVGGECQYAGAQLSPDKEFYILNCKGPDHPTTSVFSLPDNQVLGKTLIVITD